MQSDTEILTVEEAADILGRSVATVRRWCESGKLQAFKSGKQWLVARQSVEGLRRRRLARQVAGAGRVDLLVALRHLKRVDLADRDLMIPDILRFEDQLADPSALMAAASQVLAGELAVTPATEVDLPKSPFFTRTAILPVLRDRLAYQAAVASFADRADRALLPCVYGGRRSFENELFLKDGVEQWLSWKNAVKDELQSGFSWMVKTDLTAYFDTLQHSTLIASSEAFSPDARVLDALRRMLHAWELAPHQGIPQGPNASRFLQNLYFVPIDQEMYDQVWHYYRYMDDIRILGRSRHEAMAGLKTLERACRKRALLLSAQKTKLLTGPEALRDWEDRELDAADYLLAVRSHRDARVLLRRIFDRSVKGKGSLDSRGARFSLWRLTQLRDTGPIARVLANLEDLGALASVAAIYLRPFLSRPSVERGIAAFLNDPERNTSSFLAAWLLSALLDRPGITSALYVPYLRSLCRNKNEPSYLRAIGASLLLKARNSVDLDWAREEARSEFDPSLLRAYAVALARVSALDKATATRLVSRDSRLASSVNYLRGRSDLPSLLFSRNRLPIEKWSIR